MSDRFADWVTTADAVRATTKKLEKMAVLKTYLERLDDRDLVIAARLFAGAPFPRKDERVLNVGWAALSDVLLERSAKTSDDMQHSYQRHADLGDVAHELLGESPPKGDPLTLADVEASFEALAALRGSNAKRDALRELMKRATADEARYLVKIVSGETRIGLREGLLEEAIARAFKRDREEVGRANMLTGDVGETALRAKHGTLAEPTLVHFLPIGMMLATPVLDLQEVEKRFPPPYVVEDKYDGVRAQVHKAGDRVELYSRTFDRVTNRYPELLPPLEAIPARSSSTPRSWRSTESAPSRSRGSRRASGGRTSPASCARASRRHSSSSTCSSATAARCSICRFTERQAVLRAMPFTPPVLLARQTTIDASGDALVAALDEEFAAARARGQRRSDGEGPALAVPARPARHGMAEGEARAPNARCGRDRGRVGPREAPRRAVRLHVRDPRRRPVLRNVGKAYSGLTDLEIAEMTKHFLASTIKDLGRLRIVRPDTVIEVAFDQMQASDRHESGYAMRFPRIARLRPDKPVDEIDTLETVRGIAEEVAGGGPSNAERDLS